MAEKDRFLSRDSVLVPASLIARTRSCTGGPVVYLRFLKEAENISNIFKKLLITKTVTDLHSTISIC